MRDFFISSLEKLITVVVALMCIAVVVGAGGTMMAQEGGLLPAIGVLVFGGLYVILMGGMMYLFLGIYDNTKRTAEATERMAQGG
jgi:hypothetical protein